MAMENKLLWAAATKTAPQLVLERADADKDDMGLTYYAGKRGPTRTDVLIGNNYLAPGEQSTKGRITEMWLTYVEDQLDQGRLPTMGVVREKLDGFIVQRLAAADRSGVISARMRTRTRLSSLNCSGSG